MTSTDFLKRLCEGYVRSYRTFNLYDDPADNRELKRMRCRWADETPRELHFFAQLGEMLGYIARREVGTGRKRERWDLSWVDPESTDKEEQVVLYMERENKDTKALKTVGRLLGPEGSKARYLVGVLGWVTQRDFLRIKDRVQRRIGKHSKGPSLLLLVWFWRSDREYDLHAMVASKGKFCTRQGKASLDKGKYWYARFVDGWQEATGNLPGHPPSPQTKGAK